MENIALLGSTGSIGTSSVEVLNNNLEKFRIILLTANTNHELLLDQCKKVNPKYAYISDKDSFIKFQQGLNKSSLSTELIGAEDELHSLLESNQIDSVIAGIMGVSGLSLVHKSIEFGKKLLLANKESYIVAGELLNNLAKKNKSIIFPLDSEHSAIHQCITKNKNISDVSKIYLTGSGGPFLNHDVSSFKSITPDQAIAHPIWKMGKKISVDSATLMNKGLELIEARWLFNISQNDIEVLIHPEGIIHSMVEFIDKSVISQLSVPDMKIPIAYGLGFPDRIKSGSESIDFTKIKPLTFRKPDLVKFPAINLAREAIKAGGTMPAILNAANEESVKSFLGNRIKFLQIMEIVSFVMDRLEFKVVKSLDDVMEADSLARHEAIKRIKQIN